MRKPAALLALLALVPGVALAAPQTYAQLVQLLLNIIKVAIEMLTLAALTTYMFLFVLNMSKSSESGRENMKNLFFWGIIILFVMVSLWGIVGLIQATFFPGGGAATPL